LLRADGFFCTVFTKVKNKYISMSVWEIFPLLEGNIKAVGKHEITAKENEINIMNSERGKKVALHLRMRQNDGKDTGRVGPRIFVRDPFPGVHPLEPGPHDRHFDTLPDEIPSQIVVTHDRTGFISLVPFPSSATRI
jgi:hypothetical protein